MRNTLDWVGNRNTVGSDGSTYAVEELGSGYT